MHLTKLFFLLPVDCLKIPDLNAESKYFCDNCETGRMHLYGEVRGCLFLQIFTTTKKCIFTPKRSSTNILNLNGQRMFYTIVILESSWFQICNFWNQRNSCMQTNSCVARPIYPKLKEIVPNRLCYITVGSSLSLIFESIFLKLGCFRNQNGVWDVLVHSSSTNRYL